MDLEPSPPDVARPCSLPSSIGLRAGVPPLPSPSSARAATSSRQKAGMSSTTRPQTEWRGGLDIASQSLTTLPRSTAQLTLSGCVLAGVSCTARKKAKGR